MGSFHTWRALRHRLIVHGQVSEPGVITPEDELNARLDTHLFPTRDVVFDNARRDAREAPASAPAALAPALAPPVQGDVDRDAGNRENDRALCDPLETSVIE